jgi:UDP-hydrolysing UDP-N-acetyl-D-glucosamine 2-epimerase
LPDGGPSPPWITLIAAQGLALGESLMRHVALVTTSRSDWGIQRPVAAALRAREDVELSIVAAGMHLRAEFGNSVDKIKADGFEVAHALDFLHAGDSPEAIAVSMGEGVAAFGHLFARWRPDVVTLLGDRFDMFPAAVAATPHLIPLAHLHGGEVTVGAIDDALRHAMTKMAHIHFVATETYARRVRQLGERPEHVYVVGAPGLDDVLALEPIGGAALRDRFGFDPERTNVLVLYHAETRNFADAGKDVAALIEALATIDAEIVFIRPNADTAHSVVQGAIDALCRDNARVRAPVNLDRRTFLSLMRAASVMVGNSSSGIIEAPSFKLPVVNIGLRQTGRVRAANVIDCEARADAIGAALRQAMSPEFVASLTNLENPYGDGRSAERIARILATKPLDQELLLKPFIDVQPAI